MSLFLRAFVRTNLLGKLASFVASRYGDDGCFNGCLTESGLATRFR